MRLPYLVQEADRDEFDWGGVNGGVAQFMAKGDAILYAQEIMRRHPGIKVRVLDTGKRGEPIFAGVGERTVQGDAPKTQVIWPG